MVTTKQRAELTRAYDTDEVRPSNVITACATGLLLLTAVAAQGQQVSAEPAPSTTQQSAAQRTIEYPADVEDQYNGVVFYELLRKGTLVGTSRTAGPAPGIARVGYERAAKSR